MTRTCTVLLGLAVSTVLGCPAPSPDGDDGRLTVAVSVPPQTWLVRNIGGEAVDVLCVVGADQNPHSFQPTDADVSRLTQADVYFQIGMPFEESPWCRALGESGRVRVENLAAAMEAMGQRDEDHTGHDHGDHNHDQAHAHSPHTWLSPPLLKQQARRVAAVLSELSPERAGMFNENLNRTLDELNALDADLREKLAPLAGQRFFVYHPAWECFAETYGLVETAAEHNGKEPDDRQLSELQRTMRQSRLRVLLVQPQVSSPAIDVLAESADLQVVTCDPLAENIPGQLRHVADVLLQAWRSREVSP